jgi:hypothetical protein
MKRHLILYVLFALLPFFTMAQDTSANRIDTTRKIADTAVAKKPDSTVAATNCYKEWYDTFRARGAKAVPDGMQDVVIAFKSGESCHCFMGRVEVVGGKIKTPLYIQQENGEYKTFASLGRKLDADFVSDAGDQLWTITDGMSVLFRTSTQENGRLFFYKFINRNAQANKAAPSPQDLIKD